MVRNMSICGFWEHSNQMSICRIKQWFTYLTGHQIHGGGSGVPVQYTKEFSDMGVLQTTLWGKESRS